MVTVEAAKKIIAKHINPLGKETVPLQECRGRFLAENILASFPMPRFDNSAMDGFAVRAADTIGSTKEDPVSLKLIGGIAAGEPGDLRLAKGECVQCMTGAPVPDGADAVVMVEDSSGYDNGDIIKIFLETKPGRHIRYKGEEIEEGATLIMQNEVITPAELGTMATFGYGEAQVYRNPRIALFATGDELVEPGRRLEPGEIYNSNLFVLSDLTTKQGANIMMHEIIADDPNALKLFLSRALKECDVIISSGGVSMGKYDYVREIFSELGVEEHFWKVSQKPGKPLFFGTNSDTLIFGLPGNPVSCFIGFMEWVWPVLNMIMGGRDQELIPAILTTTFPRDRYKTRFLFGKAWFQEGHLVCAPSSKVGSHMLSSSLNANCIIRTDPGDSHLSAGRSVQLRILPWKPIT